MHCCNRYATACGVQYTEEVETRYQQIREINQATFNVPDAKKAYHDYTNFINKALSAIPGRGLLLDIHGHEIQRSLVTSSTVQDLTAVILT